MSIIQMKYNPFKVETVLKMDSLDFITETKFDKFQGSRLQVWVEELFPLLVEVLNDNVLELTFTGTLADFEDIVSASNAYTDQHVNSQITLNYIPVQETEDKFTELEELVDLMQSGPFPELRDPKIRMNFEKALNSEFEIAVIATMSSGKSTLINSFLGTDLMPSKNEACTAKISRIRNTPNAAGFSAVAHKLETGPQGEEYYLPFKSINEASLQDFDAFNNDPEIAMVEIEGNIPSISSGKMNLVLVDTPGPNNSMDGSHREHTLKVIKSDDKPMVLYVLNATQLRTDDDFALLRTVADAMAVGGKQSKDRFIFAVNKVDVFDPEKGEYLSDALENVRVYLEQQGIKNPNIYPVSAQTAKVIRKAQKGESLTRQEKNALAGIDLFLEEETMHLNEYAPLSSSLKNSINEKIQAAKNEEDKQAEALYYTGVPSVEAAINEYLDKYAVTSKITNAVNTFKRIVEQQQFMQNLQDELAENEEARLALARKMEEIEEQLAQGNKVSEFKKKIRGMSFDTTPYFRDLNKKVLGRDINKVAEQLRTGKIKKGEADVLLYKMQKEVLMIQDDAITDIEKILSMSLRDTAKSYLEEYQNYVDGLIEFDRSDIPVSNWNKAITLDTPDIDQLLNDFTYTEREVIGTRTVANENKRWFKPWTWLQSSSYEEDVYGNVEYVDMNDIAESFLEPITDSFVENIENAQVFMQGELKRLQAFFIGEIERLDEVMHERVREIKKHTQQTELLEEENELKKQQKQWLESFTMKLENILELKEKVGVAE
ncbi:dynamin family protein [Domibacillus robiginosus]|uniref:dynamin family protein n=1 Tax=Domibacillus robiginosus TaxID=1071054 RepID=UPI00067C4DB1|nr:dynamin family protein [Domibacillus robiginosus]